MLKKSVLVFVFLYISISSFAQSSIEFTEEEKKWIEDHPSVVYGYEPNWPPFEMYENGEYKGIVGEYVKIIEKETGIKMHPSTPKQWGETLELFKKGELKVVTSISFRRNRNNEFAFTKPFIVDPLVIVTRKNHAPIEKFSDIGEEIIALPRGYSRQRILNDDYPNTKPIFTENVKECLELVNQGKADLFVGSHSVVTYYVNEYSFKNLNTHATPNGRFLKLCFGVSKDWEVFRNITQKVINNISDNDKHRLHAKWVVLRYDEGVIDEEDFYRYLFIGISLFLLAMLLFFLWNNTLRKQINYRIKSEEELKRSLAIINEKNTEKDILLKEIHHRVKNNLQIVHSMLNMQSREIKNDEALKIVSEGKSRVMAMALIHKILYESERLDKVNIENYIRSLLNNISRVYESDKNIELHIKANGIQLNLDRAIPMGLILNELVTNSYKHAFKDREEGEISIEFKTKADKIYFVYRDNGVGIDKPNFDSFNSLGMRLVKRLANQLQTEANLESDNGIKVSFSFLD